MAVGIRCLLSAAAALISLSSCRALSGAVWQDQIAEQQQKWADFKLTFGKKYDLEEEAERFQTFLANLALADEQNAKQKAITHGVTKFMDLTPAEFRKMYLGRKASNVTAPEVWDGNCTACVRFPEQAALLKSPPTDFDWTTKGAVTKVKDQGQCGSCWSFGTTGDIEGTWFLANNALVSLSEQELVSCDTRGGDQGCNGGLQENAFKYVMANGLVKETRYPYTSGGGDSGKCKSAKTKPAVAHISAWSQVSKGGLFHHGDEEAIKTALLASGPITIGINAGHMQTYNKGIDNPFFCSGLSLDHAVLVVGYGSEDGKDYWKIKNSWNTNWGEEGYYRIVRGKNKCGVANDAVHSKI